MRPIVASAPGKLVVSGEYAVLEGAPAVVMAIDRRARVLLESRAGDGYYIDAADLGTATVHCRLGVDGRVQWLDTDRPGSARLALVAAVLEAAATEGAPAPFRARLDTSSFFTMHGTHAKLGLGSSAALTVALTAAIRAHDRRGAASVHDLIETHRSVQQGRGSGLDIAASLKGGLLIFRRGGERPDITPASLPGELESCCIWSGRSACTSDYLRKLAAWRADAPTRYACLMRELGDIADAAAAAVAARDAAALLEAVSATAQALIRLGDASGLDIVSAEHRAIMAIADECGVVYKSCGAGGGDIGIALATDSERLHTFRQRTARAGFCAVDATMATTGLQLDLPNKLRNNGHT